MLSKLFAFSLLFAVLIMPFSFAAGFDIFIEEGGKVTSFYDEYYIARVNGSIEIANPSDSEFFNVFIPLYTSTYTLRSANNTPSQYINEKGIYILELPANDSVTFDYEIGGISTENYAKNGSSVLEASFDTENLKIYSNVMGSLLKAPIEDPSFTGRNNTRLVSVHLTNPTGFDFNVDFVHVIKTNSLDPSISLNEWDFSSQVTGLDPYQSIEFDFFDTDAYEGEIYWLQTDIYLDDIDLFASPNITFFDQDDLFIPITNGTNITYNETVNETFDKRVFIRKLLSTSLALPKQPINVSVIVNNFGTTAIRGRLNDAFPDGFELRQVYTEGSSINENELTWDVDIPPRTAKRYLYEVTFVDEDSVGVDYFEPATIEYGNKFIYSQSVPFVRRYVEKKKVYLQKSLDFRANGDVEVDITVRNLGESSLSNLIVKEFLGPAAEFKEITQPFREKGVWHIEDLGSGEIWETSYVTDKTNVLNSFPELFGVPRSGLFRNIILKNVVESKFKILHASGVELFGLTLLSLVILVYLLPHSTVISLKRKFTKDLSITHTQIESLKETSSHRTDFHPKKHSSNQVVSSQPLSSQPPPQRETPHSEYLSQRQGKIEQTQAILDKIKEKINDENKK